MSNTTPGPYVVIDGKVYGAADEQDSGYVCRTAIDADAHMIARALNTHDELVAALRNIQIAFERIDWQAFPTTTMVKTRALRSAITNSRGVVAKAEKQS